MGSFNVQSIMESQYLRYIVGGAAVTVSVAAVFKWINARGGVDLSQFPHDKVTLCQIPRGPYSPNPSPYPIKLETYLRMAGIPYQNHFSIQMSPKGKFPWIVYKGEAIGDSELCIEHLNAECCVDLNAGLSDQEKAIARAFRLMLEGNYYWAAVVHRYVSSPKYPNMRDHLLNKSFPGIGCFRLHFLCKHISSQAHAQGMGRHSREEVESMGAEDLRALSKFLGDKPYLMGSSPCVEDCSVFGFIVATMHELPGSPYEKMIQEGGECANLHAYYLRMKERYWPDWDECNTRGATRVAPK